MRLLITATCYLVVLSANAQIQEFVPQNGLIAWYDFADGACDVSGLSDCFDLIDGAYISDIEGSDDLALRLDGNYAQLPADPNFNLTEFTIAFRYLFDEGSQMRMWKGNPEYPDDVNYSIKSTDETNFEQNFNYSQNCSSILNNSPNWFSASALQSPGVWLDVVITRSSTGIISINTPNSTEIFTGTSSICNETQPIRIGHWWNDDPSPSYGWVDHIGFWSTVLTESQIAQLLQRQIVSIGCMDASACNYNAENSWDDGSCEYGCLNCGPGTFWNDSLSLCMPSASNCNEGTYWDLDSQTCMPVTSCPEDLNFDGVIGVADLLLVLASFGFACEADDPNSPCGVPINYQGYDYPTVLIGEQCWFAENLKSEMYRNGDEIPSGLNQDEWSSATFGASTHYAESQDSCVSNTSINFPTLPCDSPEEALNFYGRLYNWHAVNDSRGLCPSGWHVPSPDEWLQLKLYIEESYPLHSGLVLREHGSWGNPVTGMDLFGFKLRPAGFRSYWNGDGPKYQAAGRIGAWFWTSEMGEDENKALCMEQWAFNEVNSFVWQSLGGPVQNQHQFGFSIRCLMD